MSGGAGGQQKAPAEAVSTPLLLYDGLCGFCDGTVRMILRHDRQGSMRFAPLSGSTADAVLRRHPELQGVDSLVLVTRDGGQETAFIRSEALLRIARYLGRGWSLLSVLQVVPRPVRDWAYTLFARHRHRMFGRYEACALPPRTSEWRFLP